MAENDKETTSNEAKTPSRQGEYAKIAPLSSKAIERLSQLLESRNEMVVLGACNTVLNKVIPNLKAIEVSGGTNDDGTTRPVFINLGGGFVPANITLPTSSNPSVARESATIQGADLAPQSVENNNSDNGSSQASTS